MFEFLFFIGFILVIVIVLSPMWLLYIAGANPEKFDNFWEKVKKPITIITVITVVIFALYQHISLFIESPRDYVEALKNTYIGYFIGFVLLFTLPYVFIGLFNTIRDKLQENKFIIKKYFSDNYNLLYIVTFLYLGYVIFAFWGYRYSLDYYDSGYSHRYTNSILYYQILRWLLTVLSVWTSAKIYRIYHNSKWLFIFMGIAIIFNPIVTMKFEKEIWDMIDVVVLLILIVYFFCSKKKY